MTPVSYTHLDVYKRQFVDLGDQRTGRIDVVEPARSGLGRNRLWNAVRTEHDRNAVGHLIERFDENRPLRLQRFNDIAVMDDLVPDIDGGAITCLFYTSRCV